MPLMIEALEARAPPPHTVWRLWLKVYRTKLTVSLDTPCITVNANTGKIVLVTL